MGANSFHTLNFPTFNQDQWELIPLKPFTNIKDPQYGSNFKVYANRLNNKLQLQKYDLFFNTYKEYNFYKDFIHQRNSNANFVKVKYVQQPQKQTLCTTFYQGSIFIERIPLRLGEIQDISLEEGLCILYTSIQGFQKLYEKYKYFEIQPQLICFNKDGFVKVWANKNLSKNYPEHIYDQNTGKTYQIFMQKLVNLIENLIDFQKCQTLTNFIERSNIQKPYENMLSTLQLYVKYLKIRVPRYLSSIKELCEIQFRKNRKAHFKKSVILTTDLKSQRKTIVSKNSKNLQLSHQVFNISINKMGNKFQRLQIDSLKFNNRTNSNIHPNRNICATSRAPTVRFHYQSSTFPTSPVQRFSVRGQREIQSYSKTVSTLTGQQRIHSSQSEYFFPRKMSVYQSGNEEWELDPDIAYDLDKISRDQQ